MISILAFHMETHAYIFTIQINYDIFRSDFYDTYYFTIQITYDIFGSDIL